MSTVINICTDIILINYKFLKISIDIMVYGIIMDTCRPTLARSRARALQLDLCMHIILSTLHTIIILCQLNINYIIMHWI